MSRKKERFVRVPCWVLCWITMRVPTKKFTNFLYESRGSNPLHKIKRFLSRKEMHRQGRIRIHVFPKMHERIPVKYSTEGIPWLPNMIDLIELKIKLLLVTVIGHKVGPAQSMCFYQSSQFNGYDLYVIAPKMQSNSWKAFAFLKQKKLFHSIQFTKSESPETVGHNR